MRCAAIVLSCVMASPVVALAGQGGRGAAPPVVRDPSMGPAPAPAGSAVIAGTLVAADTGRPVRRARVSVIASGAGYSRSVMTDDLGRFSLTELPAAEFVLTASRPGFLDVTYGQRQPGSGRPGTPLKVEAGQKLDRITLRIPRGGVMTGVVVDETGEPSFGANVRALRYVMRNGERSLQQAGSGVTDDRGIYRIPALLPGDYVVTATPRETTLNAASFELAARAEALKASVAAASEGARAELTAMAAKMNEMTPVAEEKAGYAPVFHPSAMQLTSATTVSLGISEEKPNVDVQLQVVPLAKISGGVIGPDGTFPQAVSMQLVDLGQAMPGLGVRGARVTPDGQFSFSQVPPGRYLIVARSTQRVEKPPLVMDKAAPASAAINVLKEVKISELMGQTSSALWAMLETSVDGRDVTNIVLPLQRGMTISGTFAFDGVTPPGFDPTRVRITMTPITQNNMEIGTVPVTTGDANGRFTLQGVLPGRYRMNVSGAAGGYVARSIQFGAVDVLDTMLDVRPGEDLANGVLTFASRLGELGGSMRDSSNGPVSDFTIVLFSAEQRYWTPQSRRIQATRPSSDGSFNFRNLPEGDYRLVAVVDPEPGQWFDAKYLETLLAGSVVVKVNDGQRTVQDLRAGR